jgi:hypothetical protein
MKGLIGKLIFFMVGLSQTFFYNIFLEMGTRSSVYGIVEVYEMFLIRT